MSSSASSCRRRVPFAAAFVLLWLCGACRTMTSPESVPSAEQAVHAFDYQPLDALLKRFVDDRGRVDYDGLRAQREPLDRFVASLAVVGPETFPGRFPTREEQLAYWINAYNALVLFQVVEREDLASVGDSKLLFFWWTCFEIDGRTFNLRDLENDVVRARYHEPRIHFALNCASLGCPRLPREAFTPARLEEQLERETERFLAEERNLTVEDGEIVLSEIFAWFPEDFGGDPLAWIRARVPAGELPLDAPVRYRPWDWALNTQVDSRTDEASPHDG